MGYLTASQLAGVGFKSYGENVFISDKCSVYGAENISLGSNVRIDDFCILAAECTSAKLVIGNYIHLAISTAIFAGAGVYIGDFCTISAKSTIYSRSDDYSGEFLLTGPHIREEYTMVDSRPVIMNNYSVVAAHSLVLPGVEFGEGAVLGSMSLAKENLESWSIFGGIPAMKIKKRKRGLLTKAEEITGVSVLKK